MADLYKVKYVRSSIGRQGIQKRTIRALGFRRLQQERIMEMTPSIQGMIEKVKHLLEVVPAPGAEVTKSARKRAAEK